MTTRAASPISGLEATLPTAWYRREDVFALEREHIFLAEWFCVARDEQLPQPGDSRVVAVADQGILLVRNREGRVRAFYNVCRHRGARLCAPPDNAAGGSVALRGGVMPGGTIVCPYHGWTYSLDGQLLRAPHLEANTRFDPSSVRLYAVGCESWGGFLFVNLSRGEVPALRVSLGGVPPRLERYPLAELRIASTLSYDVAANWKVICENYNECYHCGPVHPELCRLVPAFRENGGANLDWQRGIPHRSGADTFSLSGTSVRRSFPGLNEDEQQRHKGELVYPNLLLSVAREHVAAFLLEPLGPMRTRISCHFLFEPYEMAQPRFDASEVVEFWDLVNRQDWAICEAVQAGMSARVHEAGVFSPLEDSNLDIRRYVTERIGAFV
ncbi:MAG TPA: aromatic ring-hydroxylating dioxygenase subunit alpha [Steroidobacteraceae bacterium]|nr:aromatic ring-hydroxylating dioxygenase subunit alpha [Steroidobacteraceae bacterium]